MSAPEVGRIMRSGTCLRPEWDGVMGACLRPKWDVSWGRYARSGTCHGGVPAPEVGRVMGALRPKWDVSWGRYARSGTCHGGGLVNFVKEMCDDAPSNEGDASK